MIHLAVNISIVNDPLVAVLPILALLHLQRTLMHLLLQYPALAYENRNK
jgi:hypothetical protein